MITFIKISLFYIIFKKSLSINSIKKGDTMSATKKCTGTENDNSSKIKKPINFKFFLGWSSWVEIDHARYEQIRNNLRKAKNYHSPKNPFFLLPNVFTEEQWDAGEYIPDVFIRENGEEWDYWHYPGPTKTFYRSRQRKNIIEIEILKIGKSVTTSVSAFSRLTNRALYISMPNANVRFKHFGAEAELLNLK